METNQAAQKYFGVNVPVGLKACLAHDLRWCKECQKNMVVELWETNDNDFRTKPPVHMDMAEGYEEDISLENDKSEPIRKSTAQVVKDIPGITLYFWGVYTGIVGSLIGFYLFA